MGVVMSVWNCVEQTMFVVGVDLKMFVFRVEWIMFVVGVGQLLGVISEDNCRHVRNCFVA